MSVLRFCFPASWPGPTLISVLHPTSLALWLPDASGWLWPKGGTCQKLEVVREPGGDLSLPPPSSRGRRCPCLPEPSTFHSSGSPLGTSGLRGSSGQSLSLREQFLRSGPPPEGAACFPLPAGMLPDQSGEPIWTRIPVPLAVLSEVNCLTSLSRGT